MTPPGESQSTSLLPRSKRLLIPPAFRQRLTATTLQFGRIGAPFSWVNPTQFSYRPLHPHPRDRPVQRPARPRSSHGQDSTAASPSADQAPAGNVSLRWRSRDNRKGRHALQVFPGSVSPDIVPYGTPPSSRSWHAIRTGLWRMVSQYPYWDISWLVATIFTLGSVCWVINAFFAWLPLAQGGPTFATETLYASGITAFLGATIFELGSILLVLEAVNENREGCFGWALHEVWQAQKQALSPHLSDDADGHAPTPSNNHDAARYQVLPDLDQCAHHHCNKHNLIGFGSVRHRETLSKSSNSDESHGSNNLETPRPGTFPAEKLESQDDAAQRVGQPWQWYPSRAALLNHYIYDLGFLAGNAQLFGASIFWISGFTALPGVNNVLSPGALDGIFWTPQIVGGAGFIVSGCLYMLESQMVWYRPALGVLGWHIGFWNLIGAVGFTLCGALGPASAFSDGVEYQSALATFWGSWAFLIGSCIQWYESLDKHPVEMVRDPRVLAQVREELLHPELLVDGKIEASAD